jgi:DNA-binding NarL/FixJ family response regulator
VIRIVVVDDHMVVRAGLGQLLGTEADFQLVGTAADGETALEVVERERPDVVLMDLSMPKVDGLAATARITARYPDCNVLVLTSFSDQAKIADAFKAGAGGYLLKHSEPDQIIAAIRSVCAGGRPVDPKAARVLAGGRWARSVADQLSARELEVLALVCDGQPNRTIARALGISDRTVRAHLTRIFQRIGVTDRTQAAVWAMRNLGQTERTT